MKFATPDHGIQRFISESDRVTPVVGKEGGPRKEGGSDLRQGPRVMLDALLVPRDARGIVLLCGFVIATALGIGALLVGDPIGYAFLAGAAIGYLFLQTRMLPALIFLAIAVYGAAGGLAGGAADWVECGVGLLLGAAALFPVPVLYRDDPGVARPDLPPAPEALLVPSNGHSSAFLEVSPTRSSTKAEVATASSNGLNERLVIHSIGNLHLLASNRDLATNLEDKPVLAFMWKYLLARAASGASHVSRDGFADELSPGMSKATQRERLRKQLYDLQKDIEPPLGAVVRANRSDIWLDLDDADFDIASLRQLGERIHQRGFLIDAELAEEVRRMLQATGEQEFLAGFEELENKVTQARGTAGEVVAEARAAIANLRAELASALAEYHDAAGHPEASIPILRAVLDALPQRQDVARLLVIAYLKTGQTALASEVRRNFDLKQE